MVSNASTRAIVRDGNWLPHRFDPEGDTIHFLRASREIHRKVTFVTDEHLPGDLEKIVLGRSDAVGEAATPEPVHFIFHSAFCCSTLLARAFDIEGKSMGLKEPVILNDLVGWRLRGADPRRIGEALDQVLTLLAQPFEAGEACVIKPSNLLNGLAPGIMTLRPQANALLLYAPLEIFLKSVAKKGMWGRLWVRDLMVKQLKENLIQLGLDHEQLMGVTDLQAAAVGWLAQHALFAKMVAMLGPERVRTLDSETLLARPQDTVEALSKLFRIPLSQTEIEVIATGPAFTEHSKIGGAFGNTARLDEYAETFALHGEEIEKVGHWAAVVAENVGIPMSLRAPLLS